jgi:hypothetical protein
MIFIYLFRTGFGIGERMSVQEFGANQIRPVVSSAELNGSRAFLMLSYP